MTCFSKYCSSGSSHEKHGPSPSPKKAEAGAADADDAASVTGRSVAGGVAGKSKAGAEKKTPKVAWFDRAQVIACQTALWKQGMSALEKSAKDLGDRLPLSDSYNESE